MNNLEWKKQQSRKRISKYIHLDCRVSLNKCYEYIVNPDRVSKHGFYPFIHCVIKSRKIKNGKRADPKMRQIYYASHMDSWIYRYYSFLINEAYNKRVKIDNINNVAVAYRTDLGKSNIQFAKEAFDNIRKNEFCYILVGDFTDFFDNLNHSYLVSTEQLNLLYSTSILS